MADFAYECAKEHAAMYSIYPCDEYDDDEVEANLDNYSDNIEGYCEEYCPELHDGYTITGTPQWSQY